MTVAPSIQTFHGITPHKVVSGPSSMVEISSWMGRHHPTRVLVATNNSLSQSALIEHVHQYIDSADVQLFSECREHSPRASVGALAESLGTWAPGLLVAVGGSSVFDTCKAALAALKREDRMSSPTFIAVPTTLSGGEYNPSAGITDELGSKSYLFDRRLLPDTVILDPMATTLTPQRLWLSTGIKAMEHAVEAIWSYRGGGHPIVETLSARAIELLGKHLSPSRDVDAYDDRVACQIAAWMSMSSVATHGVRLSHIVGHQAGAYWRIPHGLTACCLLPAVVRWLGPATVRQQRIIASALGVDIGSTCDATVADKLADALEELISGLGLPTRLRDAGADKGGTMTVAQATYRAASGLGLIQDLPHGATSVADVLELAW